MLRRNHWQRFLPRRRTANRTDYFQEALDRLGTIDAHDFEALDREIERRKELLDETNLSDWVTLLILQAPRAAHAQAMMDEHPRGYHDRKARLYELIDFNDTFVSTVLLLPDAHLAAFPNKLRSALDGFCKRMYSRTFSNEQYGAIVHGLSREIAVFKAAQNSGLQAVMTSRTADAFGIDMQLRDPNSGRSINVDCKTSSSFHFRLKDLVRQKRVAPKDVIDAETKGWWEITNRDDTRRVRIILLRVSQDELGEIRGFRFVSEQAMVDRLRQILAQRSQHDSSFGQL